MIMKNQQGFVVITIVLFMIILMTSTAIVLSGTLTRHIRASRDYLSSERAFAGANSGVEAMRYNAIKANSASPFDLTEQIILYDDGAEVKYKGCAELITENGQLIWRITSSGTVRNLVRRIQVGGGIPGC